MNSNMSTVLTKLHDYYLKIASYSQNTLFDLPKLVFAYSAQN